MSLSLQKWIQLIENESDIYNDKVVSIEEIGKLFDKYNIKQRQDEDGHNSILYKYLSKSVGNSTSGESSTKEDIAANVLMSATDNDGDDVAINLKVACSLDASENIVKTGIWLVDQDTVVTSVAALCGISINTYTLGKSLVETLDEMNFDWGPYSVSKNGKNYVTCIGAKATSTTAYMYMPENLLKNLISALDAAGLFDGHPEALVPHYNQYHVYSFDNRFPNIPDKYVAKVQALVDNFNIDIYNNYIAIYIREDGLIRLWLYYADYRPAYRQTYIFNYRHALFNTNQLIENTSGSNGTLVLTLKNYDSDNHYTYFDYEPNGTMSQGPVDIYTIIGYNDFKVYNNCYCYDNLGYDYRKIEGSSVGNYRIGGSTSGLEDIYEDPNAVDLRDLDFETDLPNWYAKRIYVSTPQIESLTSTYPDVNELNVDSTFLPVKLKKGAVDNTLTQADITTGEVDDNDVNVPEILEETKELAPEIGTNLISKPSEPPINTPALPSDTMSGSESSGLFMSIVNLDDSNLRGFANWLFSTSWTSLLNNILTNAMEGVISLKKIYIAPRIYSSGTLRFLNQTASDVSGNLCYQYKAFSCGHVKINPYYKNVNDYTSTSIQLYLPFIGFQELNVSEIMDRWIEVKYYIDYLTGTCTAYVLCSKTNTDNSGYVMLTKQGNCSVELPLSSLDYTNCIRNIVNMGVSVATGSEALAASSSISGALGGFTPTLNRGGGIGSNAGAMSIKTPYIIINRQIAYDALQRQHFEGLPNNANVKLSTCKGYTRVKYINLEGLGCTEDEKAIILSKLKEGVFI